MLLAMADTLSSLFWCLVMLTYVFYLLGMLFMQGVTDYLREAGDGPGDNLQQRLMVTFGSFSKTIYTLYYVCLSGDWSTTFSLVTTLGWVYSWSFMCFIGFYDLSVANILTAMFVEQTMQTCVPDRNQAILEQQMKILSDVEDFRVLCRHYDTSRSGLTSYMDGQSEGQFQGVGRLQTFVDVARAVHERMSALDCNAGVRCIFSALRI